MNNTDNFSKKQDLIKDNHIRLWKGYEWKSYVHTKWDNSNYDNAYFGPDGIIINEQNEIEFHVKHSPRRFKKGEILPYNDGDGLITKELCCGEFTSVNEFSYGTFTWRAKMPNSGHLWPALWLCGSRSWPPEIDVVEGYSDTYGSYYKNAIATSLETNVHYSLNGKHKKTNAKGLPTILYCLFKKDIDTWKVIWTPTYIKIYWNGFLIRTVRDKDALADLNRDHKMKVIMNTMVLDGFNDKDLIDNKPLIVYDFKYEAL